MKKNADSNIIPKTAGTYNLGSAANPWNTLFAKSFKVDDFPVESGVWTPTIYGSTTAGTPIYGDRIGTYNRIGKLVFIRFSVSLTNKGGMTGWVQLKGLPYPVTSGTGVTSFYLPGGFTLPSGSTLAGMVVGSNAGYFSKQSNTGGGLLSTSEITDVFSLGWGTLVYETTA